MDIEKAKEVNHLMNRIRECEEITCFGFDGIYRDKSKLTSWKKMRISEPVQEKILSVIKQEKDRLEEELNKL